MDQGLLLEPPSDEKGIRVCWCVGKDFRPLNSIMAEDEHGCHDLRMCIKLHTIISYSRVRIHHVILLQ